jgi:predicted SnoaL-like aldol condensation-catalyzing enzyme
MEFKRFIAEDDLVAVHTHMVPAPGARGTAVMDVFRLENGKIVEHWDVLQEVPEQAQNQNTMF